MQSGLKLFSTFGSVLRRLLSEMERQTDTRDVYIQVLTSNYAEHRHKT